MNSRYIMTRDEYLNKPKLCKFCNKILSYERKHLTFCNSSCAASFNNKGVHRHKSTKLISNCIFCGTPLNNGIKYCSLKCQGLYQTKCRIDKCWCVGYMEKKELPTSIRAHLISKSNNKCATCGWGELNPVTKQSPLTIHHIDGDCHNNSIDNLIVLCPNCHSITPNYGALNRGYSKRTYRSKSK